MSRNHSTCDGCGCEVLNARKVRYEIKIEVTAAYDPLVLNDEDLQRDYRAEIARVLAQLDEVSTEEAQNQVHRVFDFDLCLPCQRRYIDKLASGVFLP
jgi:hypothetical protein